MSLTTTWDGAVATITFDRPRRRNAFDMEHWHGLRRAAQEIAEKGSPTGQMVRAVILTGAGEHFCAGMDLSPDNPMIEQMFPAITEGLEGPALDLIRDLKECVQAVADLPCPTFAAIEGACIGGGLEIALACDVRICASNASLGLTEARVGMIPDVGGTVRLTRLVGPGRAADLVTTCRRVGGEEAFRLGFVERVVAPGQALAEAREATRQVSENGPTAVALALNVVRLTPDLGLVEALSIETRSGAMALTSGEPPEGIAAFVEKRAPSWK